MKTSVVDYSGVRKIEFTPFDDLRGNLLKLYRREIFFDLMPNIEEIYLSQSKKSVVRGLHYQLGEKAQDKFVYCITGRMLDISVDLRPGKDFGKIHVEEMVGGNDCAIFIPGAFAHGVVILEDQTNFISISPQPYSPGDERGIRWDTLGIDFGISEPNITAKDLAWPSLMDILDQGG